MDKRTNSRLIAEVRGALDVSATPYFSDLQVCRALSQAYDEWLSAVSERAEFDERIKRQLSGLIVTKSALVTNGSVDLGSLDPVPYRILSVLAGYSRCSGTRAAKPLSFDAWQLALNDPWNAPVEIEPAYLDGSGQIQILPAPASTTLVYIASPAEILADNPDGKTEVDYNVQTMIIQRAAAILAIPQENTGAYQALTAEYTNKN